MSVVAKHQWKSVRIDAGGVRESQKGIRNKKGLLKNKCFKNTENENQASNKDEFDRLFKFAHGTSIDIDGCLYILEIVSDHLEDEKVSMTAASASSNSFR